MRNATRFYDFDADLGHRYRVYDFWDPTQPRHVISREREDIQFVLKDEFWLFEKGETVNSLLGTYVTCNSARAYTH